MSIYETPFTVIFAHSLVSKDERVLENYKDLKRA